MKFETARQLTLDAMEAMYPSWEQILPEERRLLILAWLADRVEVREEGGNNRGEWIEAFLEAAGLGQGYPWCAAAVLFASKVAGAPCPPSGGAAVVTWRRWAQDRGMLRSGLPRRGFLALKRTTATTGHIGVVVRAKGLIAWTIEGNTSSGEAGSQRDGDGLYRRRRLLTWWSWQFIDTSKGS